MPNEIYHKSNWGNANAGGFGDVYFDAAATNKLYNHSDYYENSNGTDKILRDLSNKASIVLTPTAYSDGSLNTVIPPYQVLPQELVTNGDFSNGTTNWTLDDASNGSISVVDGKLEIVSNGGAGYPVVKQGISTSIGKKYSVTFSVTNNTTGFWFRVDSSESGLGGFETFYANDKTSSINFKGEFTAISTTSYLKIFAEQNDAGSFEIDNISIKEIQEADFDFSRGSSATRVNEQGLIEDVQILSGELVTNGGFDTDSDWAFGTGWSIANGKASCDGSQTGNSDLYQLNVFTVGKLYRLTFDLLDYSAGNIRIRCGTNTDVFRFANGTYTVEMIAQGDAVLRLQADANFIGSIDNVSVIEITDDTDLPRIDYTSGFGSLLLEPQRTNSLLYSNLFTWSGWSKAGAGTGSAPTVTGDYAISPDGSQNASRLQLDKGSGTTTSDYSFMYETVTSVGTGSISIWMKSNDSNTYQVALRESNFIVCDVTPEWQRFELNNQASTNEIQIMLRGTYGTSNNADILIYGAQLEEGSYATSYIPTNGSTVTRSADVANNSGNADLINSIEGVLYAEIEGFISTDTVEQNRYITLTNGISNQRVALLLGGNTNQLRAIVYSNTQGINLSFTTSLTDVKQFNKLAVKYKSGDYAFFLNGTKISSSSETSIFTANTLNDISFDVGGGTQQFRGKTKELAVFKEALTDAELENLTSWVSFKEMATDLEYTLE